VYLFRWVIINPAIHEWFLDDFLARCDLKRRPWPGRQGSGKTGDE
jgi:hypothetical protein